jgi:hypothetical protein
LSDLGSAESSDEEDAVMASLPTARRRKARAEASDPFLAPDDRGRNFWGEEYTTAKTPTRRKKGQDDFVVDDDDIEYLSSDGSDDRRNRKVVKPHKLSSARKATKAPRRKAQEEQDELEADLEDLQDSDMEESATKARTRGGPVTTQRDKAREHLELLKRQRAGEKVPLVEDSEEEDHEAESVDIDLLGHPDYDLSDKGSVHSSIDTDQDSAPEEGVEGDEGEDDFVVDDPTGRLGRPHPDIPLQFTSYASAKPRELFPHVIEWLVKNKIAPAFSREDELYSLAFSRLNDQVKAQAGSRLISAAWGTTFKRAILARPEMKVVALPGDDEDNLRTCDACNRSGHPARYEFVFSGEPYYKETLEPVDLDEEDEEDDGASRDENGHVLPSQTKRFYLGRFCAANAEMGHRMTHWKFRLNESLLAYLEEQGVLRGEAVIAREKLNKKQREKQAEDVVDGMQATGVVDELWADFQNDLDDARLGMEDFERKGGRSKGRVGAVRSKGFTGLFRG